MNDADREAVRLAVNETNEDMIVVTHSTDRITNTDKVLSDIPDKAIVLAGWCLHRYERRDFDYDRARKDVGHNKFVAL